MKLRFTIPFLDLEFFRVELDIERGDPTPETVAEKLVDRAIGKTTDLWLGRLFKK